MRKVLKSGFAYCADWQKGSYAALLGASSIPTVAADTHVELTGGTIGNAKIGVSGGLLEGRLPGTAVAVWFDPVNVGA